MNGTRRFTAEWFLPRFHDGWILDVSICACSKPESYEGLYQYSVESTSAPAEDTLVFNASKYRRN